VRRKADLRNALIPPGAVARFDFVVDALFGFSYRGAPRPPFDALLRTLCAADAPPVASIDIPSGVCHRFSCCVRLR
jgi:NAD(P)H-hydrate repair Nnr-like enzyme with NAD(P)H-hydrate epimerase domain